jgi:ribonuclease HI
MSTNNEMELESVLDDFRIVTAGKKRFQQFRMLTDSEREVYDESYNRLIESGNSLLAKRAALKDVVKAAKDLQRAETKLKEVMDGPKTETDEKEVVNNQ